MADRIGLTRLPLAAPIHIAVCDPECVCVRACVLDSSSAMVQCGFVLSRTFFPIHFRHCRRPSATRHSHKMEKERDTASAVCVRVCVRCECRSLANSVLIRTRLLPTQTENCTEYEWRSGAEVIP